MICVLQWFCIFLIGSGLGMAVRVAEDCSGCKPSYVNKRKAYFFSGTMMLPNNCGPFTGGQYGQGGAFQLDQNANSYRANGAGGYTIYSLTVAKSLWPINLEAWGSCTNGFVRPLGRGVCTPNCEFSGQCGYEMGFDIVVTANPFLGEGQVMFRDSSGTEAVDPGVPPNDSASLHSIDSAGCNSGLRFIIIEAGGEMTPWWNDIAQVGWECTECKVW